MKKLLLIFIPFIFSFVANAEENVFVQLKNDTTLKIILPAGYCDFSNLEEGKIKLNQLNNIAPENYAQVGFVKCNSNDGFPWGYIATNKEYIPSSISQRDLNSIYIKNFGIDEFDDLKKEMNKRIRKINKDSNIESLFKNTSGKPSVLWDDQYLLSIGGIISGTDIDGIYRKTYSLMNTILYKNTLIFIYMYASENSTDNIYQYASFYQNFSKSLK